WGYTRDQLYVQIQGHALADAQPDMSGGAYPLVVFSHGWIGSPVIYAWLVEHIASYGFVVVAPHHIEFRDEASSDMGRALIVRHRPMVAALDYAEVLTASDGALAGMIDMEKVAVAGHSYGGWTTLVMAGARLDLVAYEEACRLDSIHNTSCPILSEEQMVTMLALEGLDVAPDGLWQSRFDPRIDVAISLAGDSDTFGERGLTEITIPILVMGGTADTGTYYENSVRTYNSISSTQKILAGFENAEHFIWAPETKNVLVYDPSTYYAFSDPVWDMSRAHDLNAHLIVAFLFSTLLGDAEATAMLAPDAVNFVGVTYEAEGF
ncbi:MAG: hypothetical protein MUE54_10650, partial [Anaerolineae bacterium]|nr:hypothetical protein [Anaerolineae bacterium]